MTKSNDDKSDFPSGQRLDNWIIEEIKN